VSPVVGVMLMLVVTIIIAAVVSAFAGGLSGSQTKTPQASFQIKTGWWANDTGVIKSGTAADSNYDISFQHLGGDPIRTKDTNLITYLTLPNGTVVRHVQTPTSTPACIYNGNSCTRPPYIYDQQKYGYPCGNYAQNYTSDAWFGNATWMSGDVTRTYRLGFASNMLGVSNQDLYDAISNHTQLEVKLLYVPSGKYIVDQKVMLQ